VVNAAPAIVAAGFADGFTEAVTLAEQAVDSGDAITVLDRAVQLSNALRIEDVNDR
jgi:anthranilate phosphoribosyltransferase